MKYLFYAFTTFIILACLTFLIINTGSSTFDSSGHLHLDVLVATANDRFNGVYNSDFITTMREMTNDYLNSDNPFLQAVGGISSIGTFLWNGIHAIIGSLAAVIAVITTPIIF